MKDLINQRHRGLGLRVTVVVNSGVILYACVLRCEKTADGEESRREQLGRFKLCIELFPV